MSMPKDCVVLLHGLGRSKLSMFKLERELKKAGYLTYNVDYPSRRFSIDSLSQKYVGRALEHCKKMSPEGKVHFVTHSLGGILVRAYFQNKPAPEGSRMIMLGPPNKGSELAEYFKDSTIYRWILGPAGQEVADGLPQRLACIPLEIGIIGGTKSFVPWFSRFFSGLHDGRVSLESTKLEEMKAFAEVETDHAVLMNDQRVIAQVRYFLENGSFQK